MGDRSEEKIKLSKWDSAEYLKTDEKLALYLEAWFEEAGGDAAFIDKALGTIARAKGMTQLAKETVLRAKVFTRHCQAKATRVLRLS